MRENYSAQDNDLGNKLEAPGGRLAQTHEKQAPNPKRSTCPSVSSLFDW